MRRLAPTATLGLILTVGAWFGISSLSTSAGQTSGHNPSAGTQLTVAKTIPAKAAAAPAAVSQSAVKGPASTARTVAPLRATQVKVTTRSAAAAGESEAAAESANETENGAVVVEGDTHEDPAGQDITHECPPSCDTANGEQP